MNRENEGPAAVPEDLIRLSEEIWYESRDKYGRLEGIEQGREEDLSWLRSAHRHTGFNCVYRVNLDPARAGERIEEMAGRYEAQELPLCWWLGPSTRPPDLARRLARQGFSLIETLTAMALDLTRPPVASRPGPGLEIRLADDREGLGELLRLFASAVGASEIAAELTLEALTGEPDPRRPYRHFLGLVEGRAAATGSYLKRGRLAMVDYISTDPGFRRQGLARNLILHLLDRARSEGCTLALLQATEMGLPLYQGLGFGEVCALTVWSRTPVQDWI